MIATVDIAVNAANPNIPLRPFVAHVGSPSQVRLRNVPRAVGEWKIDAVRITVNYPDNRVVGAACVLVGGLWCATVEASTAVGGAVTGYEVTADGTDEYGNRVEGYVLGRGDVAVLDRDSTIRIGETSFYVHLVATEGEDPRKGDLALATMRLYDGAAWREIGGGGGGGAVATVNGKAPDAQGNVEISDGDIATDAEGVGPTVASAISSISAGLAGKLDANKSEIVLAKVTKESVHGTSPLEFVIKLGFDEDGKPYIYAENTETYSGCTMHLPTVYDSPLAQLRDIPDVVAPDRVEDAGKAADARMTGLALEGKLNGAKLSNTTNEIGERTLMIESLHAAHVALVASVEGGDGARLEWMNEGQSKRSLDLDKIATKDEIPDVSGKLDAAAAATVFSATESYAVGDYVSNYGRVWRCTEAHEGAWTVEHFEEEVLTDRIASIAASIKYALVSVDATHPVADRAINAIPDGGADGASVSLPASFTDLILRTTGKVASVSFAGTGIESAFGDDLPTEGENLITVTRITATEAFVRVVALEEHTYGV